ncbi:Hypothetical protein CpCap5W_0463 [Corynebacterium pseudotuberculosis]|nr:Hypothetical protein Cp3995_0444 [Corynebacterium pseudotuberculosis 3/99-5]AIG06810.1 hypothetical protein CPTA_00981 [Corynebacterium pseudotuberculosis]AIG08608.1 hypothetical protein CPTB_00552 [Corynebacterium pseudotuberculosis]AIG10500.1 hypothetical protein CPTC_00212 [Corynebacterium pseudotuberculosis]AKJ55110.1 Hypothetical protein Cp12C_0467 [Corynebacterium pseudotuberculosis]
MKILKVYVVISGTVAEVGKNVQLCLLIGCIFMEQRFYYFGFLCGEILCFSDDIPPSMHRIIKFIDFIFE